MPTLSDFNPPQELKDRKQWLLWRYEIRDGKPTKVPYGIGGYRIDYTNPQLWIPFNVAYEMAFEREGYADGIGWVITPPYCGVDLDDCYPTDAAECAPWGRNILDRFSDTYSEVSPSGQGVKIWCRAKAPRCSQWPYRGGKIEVYDHDRFFTVTAKAGPEIPRVITDHQQDIEDLVHYLDSLKAKQSRKAGPGAGIRSDGRIPKTKRHRTLVGFAGTMHRRGMCAEAIEAALIVADEKQCEPPRGADHIRNKIMPSVRGWTR